MEKIQRSLCIIKEERQMIDIIGLKAEVSNFETSKDIGKLGSIEAISCESLQRG
jgi:hypothetical protein